MDVRTGWSGEQPGGIWRKLDVTLDGSDFERLLHDYQLTDREWSLPQVFALLALEADVLLWLQVYRATSSPHHLTALNQAKDQRDKFVKSLAGGSAAQ